MRVSPYEYSIDDPAAVRPIYGHGTRLLKGHWYDGSSNPDFHTEELFSDRDPKVHAANRRKFSSVYTMGVMLKMKQPVDECIELFVQILSEALGYVYDARLPLCTSEKHCCRREGNQG